MKKFIIFLLSFIVLLYGFEFLTGWLLTVMYTPETSFSTHSSSSVEFGEVASSFYLLPVIAGCIAFFLSQRLYHAK